MQPLSIKTQGKATSSLTSLLNTRTTTGMAMATTIRIRCSVIIAHGITVNPILTETVAWTATATEQATLQMKVLFSNGTPPFTGRMFGPWTQHNGRTPMVMATATTSLRTPQIPTGSLRERRQRTTPMTMVLQTTGPNTITEPMLKASKLMLVLPNGVIPLAGI